MHDASPMSPATLQQILAESARHHHRLCPRQVLGVRMGLLAGRLLEIHLPQSEKRLLTIAETDGCMVDGVSAATGCFVGRRTLRIEDYGKVAATFVDTQARRAIRIAPRASVREIASQYAPSSRNRWEAQLIGYQHMADSLLLDWHWVELVTPLESIVAQAGRHVVCEACGEEIINQREVVHEGTALCRSCAGAAYYRRLEVSVERQEA